MAGNWTDREYKEIAKAFAMRGSLKKAVKATEMIVDKSSKDRCCRTISEIFAQLGLVKQAKHTAELSGKLKEDTYRSIAKELAARKLLWKAMTAARLSEKW